MIANKSISFLQKKIIIAHIFKQKLTVISVSKDYLLYYQTEMIIIKGRTHAQFPKLKSRFFDMSNFYIYTLDMLQYITKI